MGTFDAYGSNIDIPVRHKGDYQIRFKRTRVTPEFREWVKNRFHINPNKSGEKPAWYFLCYVLLGDPQKETRGLPVPKNALALMNGIDKAIANTQYKRFKGQEFLQLMKVRFPEFNIDWIEASQGEVRTLTYDPLPQEAQKRIEEELQTSIEDSKKVDFLSGNKITYHSQVQEKNRILTQIVQLDKAVIRTITEDEYIIQNYLNNLPTNDFTRLKKKEYETSLTSCFRARE